MKIKILLILFLLFPSFSYAKEDVECAKKHSDVKLHCDFHKTIIVTKVIINGGNCGNFNIYRLVPKGYHWIIPETDLCHYISSLTLVSKEGSIYKFAPL